MELEELKSHSYLLLTQRYNMAMLEADDPARIAELAFELARKLNEVASFTATAKPSVKDWASDDSGLKMS